MKIMPNRMDYGFMKYQKEFERSEERRVGKEC